MERQEKRPLWESSRSILHKEGREKQGQQNSYGKLSYEREFEGPEHGGPGYEQRNQEGFVLEAKEAAGLHAHSQDEKHLEHKKKVQGKADGGSLYAAGIPFRSQAFYFDTSDCRKSECFLECVRGMLEERGHRTVQEAFGFLDRKEKDEVEALKEERKQLGLKGQRNFLEKGISSLEEFDSINKKIDTLQDRLRKKEARERQLCGELQLMLDQRREDRGQGKKEGRDRRGLSQEILEQKDNESARNGEGAENSESQENTVEVDVRDERNAEDEEDNLKNVKK